jgi:hypothetical protein
MVRSSSCPLCVLYCYTLHGRRRSKSTLTFHGGHRPFRMRVLEGKTARLWHGIRTSSSPSYKTKAWHRVKRGMEISSLLLLIIGECLGHHHYQVLQKRRVLSVPWNENFIITIHKQLVVAVGVRPAAVRCMQTKNTDLVIPEQCLCSVYTRHECKWR